MKYLAKEHHIFSMSPENKPALYVNNQEIFQLQTLDCFCGRLKKWHLPSGGFKPAL